MTSSSYWSRGGKGMIEEMRLKDACFDLHKKRQAGQSRGVVSCNSNSAKMKQALQLSNLYYFGCE
jgi:hypothetical protein